MRCFCIYSYLPQVKREPGTGSIRTVKKKSQFRSGRGATRFGHPQRLQSFSLTRSLELASAFSQAMALHQTGRLAEAEKIYGQILKVQPNHADSLHLLGVIYAQRGNHVESVRQIDLALKISPLPMASRDGGRQSTIPRTAKAN